MTERHTRQGTPSRERTQAGDFLDDEPRDWKAKGRRVWGSSQNLRVISASTCSCWCDGTLCSDDPDRPGWRTWPGKAEGAPHPRHALDSPTPPVVN